MTQIFIKEIGDFLTDTDFKDDPFEKYLIHALLLYLGNNKYAYFRENAEIFETKYNIIDLYAGVTSGSAPATFFITGSTKDDDSEEDEYDSEEDEYNRKKCVHDEYYFKKENMKYIEI